MKPKRRKFRVNRWKLELLITFSRFGMVEVEQPVFTVVDTFGNHMYDVTIIV